MERATGTKSQSTFTLGASLGRKGLALAESAKPKGLFFGSTVLVTWTDRAFLLQTGFQPEKSWRILGAGVGVTGVAEAKNRTSLRRRNPSKRFQKPVKTSLSGGSSPVERAKAALRWTDHTSRSRRSPSFDWKEKDFGGEKTS